jgi:hypothetical protein
MPKPTSQSTSSPKKTRRELASAREARKARRRLRKRFLRFSLVSGVVLLGAAFNVGLVGIPQFLNPNPQGVSSRPTDGPGKIQEDQGQGHFNSFEQPEPDYYNSSPPTSGTHSPSWARCGIFDNPLPDEIQVHNLEHGFINIQYNTQNEDSITALKTIAEGLPGWPNYYVFAPYPDMEHTVALTAWGVVQYLDIVSHEPILDFVNAYRLLGPEENAPGCEPGEFMAESL